MVFCSLCSPRSSYYHYHPAAISSRKERYALATQNLQDSNE